MRFCADLHGNMELLKRFIEKRDHKGNEYLCILGDAGINYYNNMEEQKEKEELQLLIKTSQREIFFLFVRGNHEIRPENLDGYEEINMFGGKVYVEKEFPNLIFLKDGELYTIQGKKYLVLGGGYSRDSFSRIINDSGYWCNEELSPEETRMIMEKLKKDMEDRIVVLSHMLPKEISPLSGRYGGSTEPFLQKILDGYKKNIISWHAGHYHKDIEWKWRDISFYIHNNKISKEM